MSATGRRWDQQIQCASPGWLCAAARTCSADGHATAVGCRKVTARQRTNLPSSIQESRHQEAVRVHCVALRRLVRWQQAYLAGDDRDGLQHQRSIVDAPRRVVTETADCTMCRVQVIECNKLRVRGHTICCPCSCLRRSRAPSVVARHRRTDSERNARRCLAHSLRTCRRNAEEKLLNADVS